MSDNSSKHFSQLARHLAENHIYLSVQNEDYSSASTYFLKPNPHLSQLKKSIPPKIVVVVGAGASADACDLPTGGQAAQRLMKAFISGANVKEKLILDEIHRITVEYRLERDDFETVLLALSKFDRKAVLAELNTIYGRRHYPSLAYELLAHWMKHRFIDAIVNFNFDELLDQALDDELGPKGYFRVVTDGDCPEEVDQWVDQSGRFNFPLYIKPHGTASHKSTMRFTRSSYSLLPPDLEKLLTTLFRDQVEVLVVGHAMQSVEFNDILARSGGGNLRFFALGHEKPELRIGERSRLTERMWFRDVRPAGGLGPSIEALSGEAHRNFNAGVKPRTICRHRLIAKLFRRVANLNADPHTRDLERNLYLRDRVYVEVAIAVSKAKGFVSLEDLARGRAGQYFRLLRRHDRGTKDSMVSMCEHLGLEQFGYSRDTMCLPARANLNRDRLRHPILPRLQFDHKARDLARTTLDYLNLDRQRIPMIDNELHKAFMVMYDGEEVEVSSDTEAIRNDIFASPTTLTTLTSLHARTIKMIKAHDWDSVLCSAETGKWLLGSEWSREITARKARLALIVADRTHLSDLKRRFGKQLGERVRWLPWWLHNRHVTVLLHEGRAVQAVFFERRLRSSHIVPLWLADADANIAMDAFVAYWIKADQYEKFRTGIEISLEQVGKASDRLIADLHK